MRYSNRYRVWPDGTVQEAEEAPHSHMSDDFTYIYASCAEQACRVVTDYLHRPSSDGSAWVDPINNWEEITDETPLGLRMQLVNRHAGVGTVSVLTDKNRETYTHFAPLPTFID